VSVKVSVITINYNNKPGLERTLAYLDSHTLPGVVEWLVIDGGSVDGSVDVIEKRTCFSDKSGVEVI
jgi:glycosyltransferase involved in cell wall biosynthesis